MSYIKNLSEWIWEHGGSPFGVTRVYRRIAQSRGVEAAERASEQVLQDFERNLASSRAAGRKKK